MIAMKFRMAAVLLCFVVFGASAQGKKKQSDIDRLFAMMQGRYSSEAQSKADTTYLNITLRMTPIWPGKGRYLYVEQAMAGREDKPYRVRIYKLEQRGRDFVSEIYTLKNEKSWIGKWRTPEAFSALNEDDLELKPGCEVVLRKLGRDYFAGKTGDASCPSELRGANYATSEVTITLGRLVSWDRGFAYNGNQVWGAENGGYIFDKIYTAE